MKNFNLVVLLMLGSMLVACTNNNEPCVKTTNNLSEAVDKLKENSHLITQPEALMIASKVLGEGLTRGCSYLGTNVEYVLSNSSTRSAKNSKDTLAYVINFPNEQGFVIVSADNRVYPVLAFSNEGNFSFSNEIANDNFVSNIQEYIESINDTTTYKVNSAEFDGCYTYKPLISISLGQSNPWNKYVVKEHPDCPVGCVAVATALVISHSCFQISYHGSNYPVKSIIDAIDRGPSQNSNSSASVSKPYKIGGGYVPNLPTYTYEQAVDSMAKMLYWIGKDVYMKYETSVSTANSKNAYELCKSLKLNIPSNYEDYDIISITDYLSKDHIVYMRGSDINGAGGHAWVSDGCYFCVDVNDETKIFETYIHCDWGWYGSCNGYYSGSVFNAGSYSYSPENYFAVKRDPRLKNGLIRPDGQ